MVYVAMAIFNRQEYTLKTLKSLIDQEYKDIKIVIIDNGTDDSYKVIKKKFPQIEVIKGNPDIWDYPGLAICLKSIKKKAKKGDYILFQNQDAFMPKNFVTDLVNLSEKYKRAIVVGANRSYKTKKIIYHAHLLRNGAFMPTKLKGKVPDVIEDVPTLVTRGAIFPIEVFNKDKVDNLSEKFPHYGGDYDLACRAKRAGFKLIASTKVASYSLDDNKNLPWKIKHKESKSFKDVKDLFFSPRSSNNLKWASQIIILYVPFPIKIYGLLRMYAYAIKFFTWDYLIKSKILHK